MKLCSIQDTILPDGRDFYHEVDRDSDILIITVGDSWTWGDSLGKTSLEYDDREYRTTHVYGAIIADSLSADFINIGCPGHDNTYILERLKSVYTMLTKKYKRLHIFVTLTESGRELSNGFVDQQDHYNELRGDHWPTFNEVMSNTATASSVEFAKTEMQCAGIAFINHLTLMLELIKSSGVNDFFVRYEEWTFKNLQDLINRTPEVTWHIGRNFTSICPENVSMLPGILIQKSWTEVIAEQGGLDPYPNPVHVLSKIGLDPIIKTSKVIGIDQFRSEWIDVFTQSELAIDWLQNSPYNSKRATKHPLEQAHKWWAEYLLGTIK